MVEAVCPVKAEFLQHVKEDFEMILLFRCHYVNQLFKGPVLMALNGGPDILGQIEGSAVAAEEDFFIQVYLGKINPDRTILFPIENTRFQSL